MKTRYSKTNSKTKIHDFSKSNNLINTDKEINIQIFNITSRPRHTPSYPQKLLSKSKKDHTPDFDDLSILSFSKHKPIKRGNSSNLSKRSRCKYCFNAEKNNFSSTFYGPVTPNYDLVKKKEIGKEKREDRGKEERREVKDIEEGIKSVFLKQNFFE